MSKAPITTLEDLQLHLQWAIELEHFTLPPYLCALYSLDPARNPGAEEVMRSVVIEEMLHLTLAANLLNAVGGRPRIDAPQMLGPFPACMPHSDRSFEVPLLPFGLDALEVFLKIERPALPSGLPEGDCYQTISQFYEAIECGVRELCASLGEARVFGGDVSRQVTGPLFGPGRGIMRPIVTLQAALDALAEIVEQGEGAHVQVWDGDRDYFHPDRDQVAHFFRFNELKLGRSYRLGDTPESGPTGDPIAVDWDGIYNMRPNPQRCEHLRDSRIDDAQREFDLTYCTLLQQLDQTFDGNPTQLMTSLGTMYMLKRQARALMQLPSGDGFTTAGPRFEYVAPAERVKPLRSVSGLRTLL